MLAHISLKHRRSAFTLVELLVVIGIIALLISILLPSLARARRAANAVACSSNMRQATMAILMYANDHKNQVPPGYVNLPNDPPNSYNGWVIGWDELIYPYLGGRDLAPYGAFYNQDVWTLRCPEDTEIRVVSWLSTNARRKSFALVRNADWNTYSTGLVGRGMCMSTSLSTVANGSAPTNANFRVLKITEAKAAAETLLMTEQAHEQNVFGYGGMGVADSPQGQLQMLATPLHDGKFNYAFCDGHVEALSPYETFGTGTWSNPLGMWSRATGD